MKTEIFFRERKQKKDGSIQYRAEKFVSEAFRAIFAKASSDNFYH